MAEFIEQVKLPACVLCLSRWDLHTFALLAGAVPLEGLLLKEKETILYLFNKSRAFQYLSKIFCNERRLFMGKMVKIDFSMERGLIH